MLHAHLRARLFAELVPLSHTPNPRNQTKHLILLDTHHYQPAVSRYNSW